MVSVVQFNSHFSLWSPQKSKWMLMAPTHSSKFVESFMISMQIHSSDISLFQIVKARFGTSAHILFTFYAFLCVLIVCGSLLRAFFTQGLSSRFSWSVIVGGAATVNALTGMSIIAACFLLPIGIAIYVVVGGLRATFVCDWAHTIILFIIIYLFAGHV